MDLSGTSWREFNVSIYFFNSNVDSDNTDIVLTVFEDEFDFGSSFVGAYEFECSEVELFNGEIFGW